MLEICPSFEIIKGLAKIKVFCARCSIILIPVLGLSWWLVIRVKEGISSPTEFVHEHLTLSLDAMFFRHEGNITFAESTELEKTVLFGYTIALWHGVFLSKFAHGIFIISTLAIWEIVSEKLKILLDIKKSIKTINTMGSNIVLLVFVHLMLRMADQLGKFQKVSWHEGFQRITMDTVYILLLLYAAEAHDRLAELDKSVRMSPLSISTGEILDRCDVNILNELNFLDIKISNANGDEGLRGGAFFTVTYSFLGAVKLVKGQVDAQQVLDNVSQVPSRWSELLVYFLVYFPNSRSDAPRSILPLSPTEKQQSLDKFKTLMEPVLFNDRLKQEACLVQWLQG
ncbi:hypothetical protein Fcan01_11613 [Folsomia candida]|uniref:Uncharacterized protein n=1 Tax=Folsomia candida TaxID=158441 RepID=A0A226E7P5_FOLCA|nr:hypothetical protein Fcan01_11613 [Folsomia candida]